MHHPFDDVTEPELRRRQSAKWSLYPADVLPAWVAEMDYPMAAPILAVLRAALDADDCGYAFPQGIGEDFAAWAEARWGWDVAKGDVRVVADVVTGIAELLRVATKVGDRVVIEPPVYPPFASTIRELGRVVVDAPLLHTEAGYAPDLDAIERAYAAGARAHLLCSPHNPTGIVLPEATLARIAELADRYDVLVLSDEIHAPLTLPGVEEASLATRGSALDTPEEVLGVLRASRSASLAHRPFTAISEAAARRAIVLSSASKTWNLAGLKAAMMIASSDETRAVLARLAPELPYHAGHLGVLAARAAFREGELWRQSTLAILDRNRALLGEFLREHLPSVRWHPQEAGYLAWLDCSALGLGDNPAAAFLDRGRVALSSGPTFGVEGKGFARLNIATSRALLEEAVRRMARAAGPRA